MAGSFLIARNPDPESKLPYLLRLPIEGGIVLKARETWPRTKAVYCYPDGEWHPGLQIVEELAVRSCVRRGPAVDLVLARGRDNRSQFIFTTLKSGHPGVFWQTQKTTKNARVGIRVPKRKASGLDEVVILIDSRERYGYRFAGQRVRLERRALSAGDYAVEDAGTIVAAVERKTLQDLAKRAIDGSLQYALAELSTLPRAAIVVEDRYSRLFKLEHVKPGFVPELLARLQVRYPSVPIVFCETRPLAEQWTMRFLAAALVELRAISSTAAEDPPDYKRPGRPASG
ncbi:MAG: ERCC4 domain-containing protein [Actinomycetota bacterium]